jgi:hypothetical protein
MPATSPADEGLALSRAEHTRHARLLSFNEKRLRPALPVTNWRRALGDELDLRTQEIEFIEGERMRVAPQAAAVPRDPGRFVSWFASLDEIGPGQHDPLFPYLADHATRAQMCWFLSQEVAGEAGFDDLVALTQIKLPTLAKLELARNYWDEMGRGKAGGMHGRLLADLAAALDLEPRVEETVWESLALGNLLTGLAANRCYTYQSIGALGVVELTAPGRAAQVNYGLKRLGVDAATRQYFALHATLDVKHAEAWNREVITTLVAERRGVAPAIAEGALMRLNAGARCFVRYRHVLGIIERRAAPAGRRPAGIERRRTSVERRKLKTYGR